VVGGLQSLSAILLTRSLLRATALSTASGKEGFGFNLGTTVPMMHIKTDILLKIGLIPLFAPQV
jgi:hypothetical protein